MQHACRHTDIRLLAPQVPPSPCVVADAKKLAAKGAEVAAVDQTDTAALRAALDGVYGVFYVTVTLEIAVLQAEYEQGVLPTKQRRMLPGLASFRR